MGPEVAAGMSMASLALEGGGKVAKGFGESTTQDYLAARDERKAELGRVAAVQTDAQFREELNVHLANIDSIRAAAGIDAGSPTTAVLKEESTRLADRERKTRVGNILAQADEDSRSASYRRSAAESALFGSFLSAGATVGRGLASVRSG